MSIKESNLTPGYSADVGPKHGITVKQRIFIQEYLIDGNGARAAKEAGYKHPVVMAARLMNPKHFPFVAAEVERLMEERNAKCKVKHEQVIEELARVAFVNPKRLLDADGNVIQLKDLPEEVAAAISEMNMRVIETEDESGKRVEVKTTVKFHDKLNALRQLTQVLGMISKTKGNLGDNITNILQINWGEMTKPGKRVDLIEQKIAEVEALSRPSAEQKE